MANIIPMSGSGSRFADAGFLLPKPLIPVSGKPMIARVIESMPPADKWIFIIRAEHAEKFAIDLLIKSLVPRAIVIAEKNPIGQASTCMLAVPYLDPDEDMFIAACDNSFIYNKKKFAELKTDSTIDAIIWTFTKNKLLSEKPEAWGWVELGSDSQVIVDMSVKIPVSDKPFNDHAVVATFYFKKAGEFAEAYAAMVKADYKIKNEFYVDSMPIFYKKLGKRSVIFDVDLYVGWGKPQDLYEYERWEYFCSQNIPYGNSEEYVLWKQFFASLRN